MKLIDLPSLRNFTHAQLLAFLGVPNLQNGYINGCALSWVSASAIDVGLGALHIEGLGRVVEITALTHATGLTSLTPSAFAYAYAYAPTPTTAPTLVVANVAPASPYVGTARSASSTISGNAANLHRWLGAVKTDGAGTPAIRRFIHQAKSGLMLYRLKKEGGTAWARVLTNGTATTATDVDCSVFVPPQSQLAQLDMINIGLTQVLFVAAKGDGVAVSPEQAFIQPNSGGTAELVSAVPLDSNQFCQYLNSASGGGSYIDGMGYYFER